tara:strand:+ start:689 stop:1120 length:432 start_codon:yes stop_codon:yes gene_type:complete
MTTLALVTGGFDPLHSGHIEYFKAAKQLGDALCVAVNSNDWLIRKKGKYFMTAPERISIIKELKMVDACIEFNDKDDTANDAIKMALEVYDDIIFANGGDRGNTNTPEYEEFRYNNRVKFMWGVGGDDKKNSSSWILDRWTTK